ncbi:MAG: hypothetical protein ACLPTZ_22385 [Beijerinckiaceae bacterium]
MNEAAPNTKRSFRRYENGDSVRNWSDLTKKIVQIRIGLEE